MEQIVKHINFNDGELLGIKDETGVWLGVRKACLDIGMSENQADRQVKNIRIDEVLKEGSSFMTIPTRGGKQKVWCIKEDYVTLWLAKISLTPTFKEENPIAYDRLLKYQLNAQKVLHEAFMSTEEKAKQFYSNIGVEGKILELTEQVDRMQDVINSLNKHVRLVLESQTIDPNKQNQLQDAAKQRVVELLGEPHTPDYKQHYKKYYKELYSSLKDDFNKLPNVRSLNPIHFDVALEYVKRWVPNKKNKM